MSEDGEFWKAYREREKEERNKAWTKNQKEVEDGLRELGVFFRVPTDAQIHVKNDQVFAIYYPSKERWYDQVAKKAHYGGGKKFVAWIKERMGKAK